MEQPTSAETPMVEIPEGLFTMGFDGMQALEDERPKHQVWLPAFFMDLHEVTTVDYAAFLAATNRDVPWQWNTVDLAQHRDRPVIGVDWPDADAYCRWEDKRLPTEADVQDLSVSLPKPFEPIRQFRPAGASVRQLADEQCERLDVSSNPQRTCIQRLESRVADELGGDQVTTTLPDRLPA